VLGGCSGQRDALSSIDNLEPPEVNGAERPCFAHKVRAHLQRAFLSLSYAHPVSTAPWQELVSRFAASCERAGLDLVKSFAAADYNQHAKPAERIHDFDSPRSLAVLVGNTRAIWPAFADAYAASSLLATATDPLDLYVSSSIERAATHAGADRFRAHFSHVTSPQPLPIQRLAELVGFAALAPSHLAVHTEHGPWIALRAVVTFDIEGPTNLPQPAQSPCKDCPRPCVPALEQALARTGMSLDSQAVTAHAADWIAVRDACPVGRASRYGEEQLLYHYGVERRLRQGS
jgi:methylmalonic aciduria homocystinuria type C protein